MDCNLRCCYQAECVQTLHYASRHEILTNTHLEKLLQAITALNNASALSPEHPELHIRLVDLKQRSSTFPQQPPAPIGPVFVEGVAKLISADLSLDTHNSQYLQRHGSNGKALLASARVLQKLGSSQDEVEQGVFAILDEGVEIGVKVCHDLSPISEINIDDVLPLNRPP